ncbi:hypothetical protein BHYA_0044g00300 [Botrytis hyacinthi]|uniref:Uncharacterized protein n=1 Tax=Botrytis hyacinthi TaxID=278943 RepID=A0A4Z1GWC9_9HELO|nr:hypothetical protein BHYA_0044g00300 [Botrytis hyacinthi]
MRFPRYEFGPRCSAPGLGSRQYINSILRARLRRACTALQEQILTDLGTWRRVMFKGRNSEQQQSIIFSTRNNA